VQYSARPSASRSGCGSVLYFVRVRKPGLSQNWDKSTMDGNARLELVHISANVGRQLLLVDSDVGLVASLGRPFVEEEARLHESTLARRVRLFLFIITLCTVRPHYERSRSTSFASLCYHSRLSERNSSVSSTPLTVHRHRRTRWSDSSHLRLPSGVLSYQPHLSTSQSRLQHHIHRKDQSSLHGVLLIPSKTRPNS